ncbi:hypothetical protein BH09SUM1_BH09SUM1_19470 [soil metagenome]
MMSRTTWQRLCTAIIAALFLTSYAAAGMLSDDPKSRLSTVPNDREMETAVKNSKLDLVAVNFEGWRETLPSFARLKVYEITGRTAIHGQDPVYTILSMMYEGRRWASARILPVEHPDLLPILKLDDKWVSPRQVMESEGLKSLVDELQAGRTAREELRHLQDTLNAVAQAKKLGDSPEILSSFADKGITPQLLGTLLSDKEQLSALKKTIDEKEAAYGKRAAYYTAGEHLLDRAQAAAQITGDFRIVPDSESVDGQWVHPVEFQGNGNMKLLASARAFDLTLQQAFGKTDPNSIASATSDFLNVVQQSRGYPSLRFRELTNFYVRYSPFSVAAYCYLLGACTMGCFLFFRSRKLYWTGLGLMIAGFLSHATALGIRLYLTKHMPVSNMFESITFASFALMVWSFIFEARSRRGVVCLGAMMVAFLLLTGAGLMPLHQTRISPLRAVLDSYWLNIHVTMMLCSYAAFSMAAFFAASYLLRSFLGREALFGGTPMISMQETEEFAYRLVQVGWPILTFGVALGAMWADKAWGRYWGWDPKETWAFITWVTFTVYLHSRMVMGWRGRWSACACLAGFTMVMITWWGVSYVPWFSGGLHSYASPN